MTIGTCTAYVSVFSSVFSFFVLFMFVICPFVFPFVHSYSRYFVLSLFSQLFSNCVCRLSLFVFCVHAFVSQLCSACLFRLLASPFYFVFFPAICLPPPYVSSCFVSSLCSFLDLFFLDVFLALCFLAMFCFLAFF